MTLANSATTPVTRLLMSSHCAGCTQKSSRAAQARFATSSLAARCRQAACRTKAAAVRLLRFSASCASRRALFAADTSRASRRASCSAASRAPRIVEHSLTAIDDGRNRAPSAPPGRAAPRQRRHLRQNQQHKRGGHGSVRVVGLCKSKGHGGAKREKLGNRGTGLRGGKKQRRRRRCVQLRRKCAERALKEQHVLRPHRYERSIQPSRTKVHLLADTRTLR